MYTAAQSGRREAEEQTRASESKEPRDPLETARRPPKREREENAHRTKKKDTPTPESARQLLLGCFRRHPAPVAPP